MVSRISTLEGIYSYFTLSDLSLLSPISTMPSPQMAMECRWRHSYSVLFSYKFEFVQDYLEGPVAKVGIRFSLLGVE